MNKTERRKLMSWINSRRIKIRKRKYKKGDLLECIGEFQDCVHYNPTTDHYISDIANIGDQILIVEEEKSGPFKNFLTAELRHYLPFDENGMVRAFVGVNLTQGNVKRLYVTSSDFRYFFKILAYGDKALTSK